jgi:hypothetical protein
MGTATRAARCLVREGVAEAMKAGLLTTEVYAMEREPRSLSFWEYLLQTKPNTEGQLTLLGQPHPAKGWRLATTKILL